MYDRNYVLENQTSISYGTGFGPYLLNITLNRIYDFYEDFNAQGIQL